MHPRGWDRGRGHRPQHQSSWNLGLWGTQQGPCWRGSRGCENRELGSGGLRRPVLGATYLGVSRPEGVWRPGLQHHQGEAEGVQRLWAKCQPLGGTAPLN